jgi:LmbE family N-acetylglucosaminyl deacetylase
MSNILILAAHPDDEILGCGGTIARRVQEGHRVAIVIFGEGITSRYARRDQARKEDIEKLHAASLEAGRVLGVNEVRILDLPDNRFDTVPLLDVVKKMEALIGEFTPSTVFTHHGGDLNVDHSIIHRATLIATRPMAGSLVREVYSYEVSSSTEWSFGEIESVFNPTTFVEIAGTLETKIKAMAAYESELRIFPHPRSPDALRAKARHLGSVAGVQAAEAFRLIRKVEPASIE